MRRSRGRPDPKVYGDRRRRGSVRVDETVRRSRTYRALVTLRRWAAGSVTARLGGSERVLRAAVGAVVLASVVSVLGSNLGAAVKFLSFLLAFALVAAVVRPFADPPAE